jgi:hypothetical protein
MDWGISPTSVGRLQQVGAPYGLLVVLAYLHALCGPISRSADLVEFFAGSGHLSAQFRARGMHALTFDVSDDPDLEDMTTVVGMIHSILLVLQPVNARKSSAWCGFLEFLPTLGCKHHLIGASPQAPWLGVGRGAMFVVYLAEQRHKWSLRGQAVAMWSMVCVRG